MEGFVQGPDENALKGLKSKADNDKLPDDAHGEVSRREPYVEDPLKNELMGDVPYIDAEAAETFARLEKEKSDKSMEKLRQSDI